MPQKRPSNAVALCVEIKNTTTKYRCSCDGYNDNSLASCGIVCKTCGYVCHMNCHPVCMVGTSVDFICEVCQPTPTLMPKSRSESSRVVIEDDREKVRCTCEQYDNMPPSGDHAVTCKRCEEWCHLTCHPGAHRISTSGFTCEPCKKKQRSDAGKRSAAIQKLHRQNKLGQKMAAKVAEDDMDEVDDDGDEMQIDDDAPNMPITRVTRSKANVKARNRTAPVTHLTEVDHRSGNVLSMPASPTGVQPENVTKGKGRKRAASGAHLDDDAPGNTRRNSLQIPYADAPLEQEKSTQEAALITAHQREIEKAELDAALVYATKTFPNHPLLNTDASKGMWIALKQWADNRRIGPAKCRCVGVSSGDPDDYFHCAECLHSQHTFCQIQAKHPVLAANPDDAQINYCNACYVQIIESEQALHQITLKEQRRAQILLVRATLAQYVRDELWPCYCAKRCTPRCSCKATELTSPYPLGESGGGVLVRPAPGEWVDQLTQMIWQMFNEDSEDQIARFCGITGPVVQFDGGFFLEMRKQIVYMLHHGAWKKKPREEIGLLVEVMGLTDKGTYWKS